MMSPSARDTDARRPDGGQSSPGEPVIRPFRPEDKPGVVAVISKVYNDLNYIVDFDEFEADLVDIATSYHDAGGEFWVLDDGGVIAGSVGVMPKDNETVELKRLYLGPRYRRRGFGTRLLATARGWAIAHGYRRMYLWSDVLFEQARLLYIKTGFTPSAKTRAIDPTNPTSVERYFELDL